MYLRYTVALAVLGLMIEPSHSQALERIPCDPYWQTVYKCDPSDMSYAIAFGMNMSCSLNRVCNIGYFEPCQPCIDNVHWCSDIISCKDETTVVIANNVFQCPNGFKCNENFEQACIPCVKGKEMTTTTTRRPTPTTKKISIPPNCNDGKGNSDPCRAGPPHSNYYYQCTRYSYVWYDYQAKPCALKRFNLRCRNANVCN